MGLSPNNVGQVAALPSAQFSERRLAAIAEQAFELLMIVDRDNLVQWANGAFERVLGYPPETIAGTSPLEMIHEDDLPALVATIQRLAAVPGASGTAVYRWRAADGSWRWMDSSATNLFHDPAIRGFVVSMRDVTDQKQTEESLRETETRYADLVVGARDAVFTAELDGQLLSVNPAAERMTGYSHEELLETNISDLIAPEDADHAVLTVGPGEVEPVELRLIKKDGSRIYVEVTGRVLEGEDGVGRREGIARETTERHDLEELLRAQAVHDALTGLPNRVLLDDRIGQALARRDRQSGDVAVLLLDLDNFKLINDSLGHQAGDELLVELAGRLHGLLRSGETVARLGGDEFAIVAEGVSSVDDLVALAGRIGGAYAHPFRVADTERQIAGSVGIAVANIRSTPESLLRDADTALYRAKASNKGSFAFFDAALRASLLHKVKLGGDLGAALRKGELEVHYQPIVRLSDGSIAALEALVRWNHPDFGWLLPDAFVPLAEENGLIVPLGAQVLEAAAAQCARWRAEFPNALPRGVRVNVSALELAERGYASRLAERLGELGLAATDISLELTEHIFIDQRNPVTASNLAALAKAGTPLILDDFGTGYSALSSLKYLPLAAIKIDRSFIRAIRSEGDEAPITRAIIALGGALGLPVTVEGVETSTQLGYLRSLGCQMVQGFLTGRPASAEATSALLRSDTAVTTGRLEADRESHDQARGAHHGHGGDGDAAA